MSLPFRTLLKNGPRRLGLAALTERNRARGAASLRHDRSGAVAVLAALALTVVCGFVGLAVDVGIWYRTSRAMQNAADAAAIAAARDGSPAFAATGRAVAARYGFTDGVDGITVTIVDNQTCPSGTTSCYRATINEAAAPQYFSQVLGVPAPPLSSGAVVDLTAGSTKHFYCMLALAGSGTDPAVRTNGAPKADMAGCSITSNSGMTCNGSNLNADFGDAAGINKGCGNVQHSNLDKVVDPYASLATTQIPPNTCSSYWHKPNGNGGPAPPAENGWFAVKDLSAKQYWTVCGDLQLTANTVVKTGSGGAVVVIENGTLDLNSFKLLTAPGSGLALVFTGNPGSYAAQPYPTGFGDLNIEAAKSGPWSGIAIYLDPAMPPQTISYAGNSPAWNITGVVYMPRASLTFSGAVNKSATGSDCFVLVVDNIRINGTGLILAHGGCGAANVVMPSNTVPGGSPALVL